MNPYLVQAQFLLDMGRGKEAENAIRKGLATDPHNGFMQAALGLALMMQDKKDAALDTARQAIQLAPDTSFPHYVMAQILTHNQQWKAAIPHLSEAIRIDPEVPRYHFLMGGIQFESGDMQKALEQAQEALRIEPEYIPALNLRAQILMKRKQWRDASEALEIALKLEPNDARTHAMQGWLRLNQNQIKPAIEHFRDALRLDPSSSFARTGVVEAMKARNPIYRAILGYFLWIERMEPRTQYAVVIGGVIAYNIALPPLRENPQTRPLAIALTAVWLSLVLLTWTAPELFALILRLDKFGRIALTERQIRESNWVGLCLLAGAVLAIAGAVIGSPEHDSLLEAGALCAMMILPVAGLFRLSNPLYRQRMRYVVFAFFGLIALSLLIQLNGAEGSFGFLVVIGIVVYTWIVTYLRAKEAQQSGRRSA